jgi:hypothetical protein
MPGWYAFIFFRHHIDAHPIKEYKERLPDTLAFSADECQSFCRTASGRGKDAEISAGVTAAGVPSAGMTLYQTDFFFAGLKPACNAYARSA